MHSARSSAAAGVAAFALLLTMQPVFAQTYDHFAHLGRWPSTPYTVRSERDCADFEQQLAKKADAINEAHEQCLRAEGSTGFSSRGIDTKSTCSKPACQSLHDGRDKFFIHAGEQKKLCRSKLSEYQNEQRKQRENAQRRADSRETARRSEERCEADWKRYRSMCHDRTYPTQHRGSCKEEFERLRIECP